MLLMTDRIILDLFIKKTEGSFSCLQDLRLFFVNNFVIVTGTGFCRFLKKNKKNNIKGGICINGKRYMTTDPTILSDIYMTCMNETGEIPYMECWG